MAKRKNNQRRTIWLTFLGFVGLGLVVGALLYGNNVALFNPKGLIADEQRRLMVVSTLIMVAFCVPVLFALYFFAWKYRETNTKAHYSPHGSRSKLAAIGIWGAPFAIMLILAAIMIPATFRMEPQDPIHADKATLKVQVVALRWKWLFIYPEQNVATVNYVQLPVDTPVEFELTADQTPMSSFWIPQLAGQLYAMTEHVNRLNLIPHTIGEYQGSAAEINGEGFAGMRFKTQVSSQEDFDKWVDETRKSGNFLSTDEYKKLVEPSENNAPAFYAGHDPVIYSNVLSKYGGSHQHTTTTEHEGHH